MKKRKEQRIDTYCQQINQECFWEYHMSNAEILKTAQKGNDQEKYFLFTKIIENTTDILKSLSIFNVSDQKKMDIPELQWNL